MSYHVMHYVMFWLILSKTLPLEIKLITGWKGLKMSGHLMVATIGSPATISNGPTSLWAEPELDSFFK